MSVAASAIPVREVCRLIGIDKSTAKRRIDKGIYRANVVHANGGRQYLVELSSLPGDAQLRYAASRVQALPPAERLAAIQRLPMPDDDRPEVARQTRTALARRPPAREAWTVDQREAAHAAFERLPTSAQEKAESRTGALLALASLDPLLPLMERYRRAAKESGHSLASLRRWHQLTKNLDRRDWAPALAPAWGKTAPPKAEMSEAAWQFILNEWACQSQPALKAIYRRALKEAEANGWTLPSYKTIQRRIAAIPAPQLAFLREGEKGLDRLFPELRRNYATLRLHQIWCSDGRKGDLFCEWPDGYIGRPIVVAWQEMRSRKVMGWAIGRTETAELARLTFYQAARNCRALPESAYVDNGRAYAAKEMTGGQVTRNRFKINHGDPLGIFTLMDVDVIWATPYRGQSKPIESYWNWIAQAERCAAFAGSYCGNRPDAKPEDFSGRAIPIATYEAFLHEAIEEKNALPHRGSGMDGKSPNEVYAELLPSAVVRAPTEWQLRLCLSAAESVRLDKAHGFSLCGNRYWAEALTQLDRSTIYHARYNPADLSEPVALYAGRKLIAEVPLWREGDFRSRTAAKDNARAKNAFKKAQRAQAKALLDMDRSRRSWESEEAAAPSVIVGDGAAPPAPKVVRPVRLPIDPLVDRSKLRTVADEERKRAEFEDLFERGRQMMAEEPRRANGGG